jgi:hypothetical protein
MEEDSNLNLTAYHEAGHCVLATLLGAKIENATISPDSDEGPRRYGNVTITWRSSTPVEFQIKAVLAGPVAEMIYSQEPFHPGFKPESSQDWKTAWSLAKSKVPDQRKRLRYLEIIVSELYRQMNQEHFWSAIAAVSDLLLAHEDVGHEEIVQEVAVWVR